MNISEDVKLELSNAIKNSLTGLTAAAQGLTEELPKVAKEVILYHGIVDGVFTIATSITIFALTSIASYFLYPRMEGLLLIIPALVDLGCIICVFCSAQGIAKALLTPRLFLLEYVVNLLKPAEKEKS